MASSSRVQLLEVARRHWLLVLAAALVAAVAASGVTSLQDVTYRATATIAIDSSALARTAGLPGGERILTELRTQDYYDAVAAASGLDAAVVRQGLDSFAEGQPIERINIVYAGTDDAVAEKVAEAAGTAAMDVIHELGATERERHEEIVEFATAAIAASQGEDADATAFMKLDAAYKLFTLQNARVSAEYTLKVIDSAHVLQDGVTVTQTSVLRAILTSGAGGAVIGLVIGIGLAYLRERSARAA